MPASGDYPGHPPAMWRDLLKVDLWKTAKRMVAMRSDFERFRDLLPIGSTAPAFSLRDAGGTLLTLEELRGRVVVLEFGAIT